MKKLLHVYQSSKTHWVGDGFPVRSIFDYNGLGRDLSPFLLLDYVAPYKFPPTNQRRGVGAHPHKGFETVTIAFQGEVEHRDSSGGGGTIGPGDVQWMTAGKGIVHEEFQSVEFSRTGGIFEMVQLWVNLRAQDKDTKPRYQNLLKEEIPVIRLLGSAGTVRVIAGEYDGHKGPAETFTPINLWDVNLRAGESAELPSPNGHTSIFLVLSGQVKVDDTDVAEGNLAVFARSGDSLALEAQSNAHLLLMDGEPLEEPVVGRGPFVMNTHAEIQNAFEDYQLGRMGEIPATR